MFSYLPSGKLTWPWKTKLLKMYSLLKNGDIPIALLVCRRVDFWWILWAHELYIVSLTITIHVWYIYLHLVHFYGKCREIYQSHGMIWVRFLTQFRCIHPSILMNILRQISIREPIFFVRKTACVA